MAIVTYGGDEQGSPAVEHILLAGQPLCGIVMSRAWPCGPRNSWKNGPMASEA